MHTPIKLSFLTLLLLISFAAVNAVMFTPAMPAIVHFFDISKAMGQQTITWFLIGYALSQLIYGPIADRFGRKPALYFGTALQIFSSVLCVLSGYFHYYFLLVLGRFFLALGSGVGLTLTFTLVNESYTAKIANKKISYLMLAFAITPGLSIALGGWLTLQFGWLSCFYASAVYGLVLLILLNRLPETHQNLNNNALKASYFLKIYWKQFKNQHLILGGLMMGASTTFIYIFAAVAPFIAINLFGMNSAQYGFGNLLPPIGLLLGSLCSARLSNYYSFETLIRAGILIVGLGVIFMFVMMITHQSALISLFFPMVIVYFGCCFILANASSIAMQNNADKAHGSSVMSFMNMGTATIAVLCLGLFHITALLLPILYFLPCLFLWLLYTQHSSNAG